MAANLPNTRGGSMAIKVRINELMVQKFGERSNWPTNKAIADELGVQPVTITGWLRGTVSSTQLVTLDKWCKYFGVQPGDILVYEE